MTEYVKIEKQVYDSTLRVSMERATQLQEATKLLAESSRHIKRLLKFHQGQTTSHKLLLLIDKFLGVKND